MLTGCLGYKQESRDLFVISERTRLEFWGVFWVILEKVGVYLELSLYGGRVYFEI